LVSVDADCMTPRNFMFVSFNIFGDFFW
jgi:hypothetical protein